MHRNFLHCLLLCLRVISYTQETRTGWQSLHEISILAWEKTQTADSGYAHKQSKHCKIYSPTAPPAVHFPTLTIRRDLFAQSASLEITHLEELLFENIRGKRLGKGFGRQRVCKVEYAVTPNLTLSQAGVVKSAVCMENVPDSRLLSYLVGTYALVEAAMSCAPR